MKNRQYGMIISAVFMFAIVAVLGIVYAAFSQQLTIDGSSTVKASSWKINFANISAASLSGTAKELTSPTLSTNDTKIGDYSVTLTTPGDSVSYTFDVENNGTFNAAISSVTIPTPVCTGSGTNATNDAGKVCKNVIYTLTYSDGSKISVGDKLDSGSSKTLKLTITYSANTTANELPSNDVAISNLATTIIYAQAS